MFARSRLYASLMVTLGFLVGCTGESDSADSLDIAKAAVPIKVVVMAMFERGEPTGDDPGELQRWLEGLDISTTLPFEAGESNLYLTDDGVLTVLLGGGIPNATATVMALGYDERVDVSKAYWLVA
ncbi:MAG: purine nucleoside permease, partial [Pseudomonadota bacterium]